MSMAGLGAVGLAVGLFLAFGWGLTRSRYWPIVTFILIILILAMLLDRCSYS